MKTIEQIQEFLENELNELVIRTKLNLFGTDYDSEWNEWKTDILATLEKHKDFICTQNNSYCLESDLQFEKDYMRELGIKLKIKAKENGLVFYLLL